MASGSTDLIAYFGYGSLVNRASLQTDFVAMFPATLKGWRRHWQPRPANAEPFTSPDGEAIALLSVHRDAASEIDGMIVIDHRTNLFAVDERERAYERVALEFSDFLILDNGLAQYFDVPIHVYSAPDMRGIGENGKILRSYLDVVMAGFEDEFSVSGVERFVASTDGFECGIIEDRDNPGYPRHQHHEQRRLDHYLQMCP